MSVRGQENPTEKNSPCCSNPNIVSYCLKHDQQPIQLPDDLLKSLEMLLWYIPGVNASYQSEKFGFSYEIITNPLYDDFCFKYILRKIQFDAEKAICETNVPALSQYQIDAKPTICINCQTVILQKDSRADKTKTACLLRHLRNCLAHGRFNICGDLLIGFDFNIKKHCTAYIKINPKDLYGALNLLSSGITKEALFCYAFEKVGYQVTSNFHIPHGLPRVDMVLEKDGRRYAVEIKDIRSRYISHDEVVNLCNHYSTVSTLNGYIPVLIIDGGKLRKISKIFLKEHEIRVEDIDSVKALLSGVDILTIKNT